MGRCGNTTHPGDHTPSDWYRLNHADEAQHGTPVWVRKCLDGCGWEQNTTVDPSDPEHPDAALVR